TMGEASGEVDLASQAVISLELIAPSWSTSPLRHVQGMQAAVEFSECPDIVPVSRSSRCQGWSVRRQNMKDVNRLLWLGTGLMLGAAIGCLYLGQVRPALAANDRYEDYIMCTGTVYATARGGRSRQASPCDGVWLLDYRNGKLLGTIIDRYEG